MLDTLQNLLQEVSTAAAQDDLTGLIVRRVREAADADACSVHLVKDKGGSCLPTASEGLEFPDTTKQPPQPCEGLIRLVCERQEAVNVGDVALHPSCQAIGGTEKDPLRAFLGAPITHEREILGVLVSQRREPNACSPHHDEVGVDHARKRTNGP